MKLYRFLSFDSFRSHSQSNLTGEIHFSRWQDFNDPMEGYFVYLAKHGVGPAIKRVMSAKNRYGVACFAQGYHSVLMWSYYAQSHHGVCLEYDIKDSDLPVGFFLESIRYVEKLPRFEVSENIDEASRRFLFTKLSDWKQEEEVRLLAADHAGRQLAVGKLVSITYGLRWNEKDLHDSLRQSISDEYKDLKAYQAIIEDEAGVVSRRVFDRYKQNHIPL